MKNKFSGAAVGTIIGKLLIFFLIPLLILKLWGVVAAAYGLATFSYWFWLGITYTINYFLRNRGD